MSGFGTPTWGGAPNPCGTFTLVDRGAGHDHGDWCRWGVAEQNPRPGRPGLPPDRRVDGPAFLRPARRPGSFVMGGAPTTKECDGWRTHDNHPRPRRGQSVTPVAGGTAGTGLGPIPAKIMESRHPG